MGSNHFFRRVLSVGVALLLIGSVSYVGVRRYNASHAATGGIIAVSPVSATLTAGQTTSVTVSEDSGSTTVNAVQFQLNYDAAKLQYVSMAEGGTFTQVLSNTTSTPGSINVARGTDLGTSTSGPHPIVTLNFKVLGGSGSTNLTFDPSKSGLADATANVNIAQTYTNGTYTLQGTPTPTPAPTPAPAPSPTPTPTPTPVGFKKDTSFTLNPPNGNFAPGSNVQVAILINTPTQQVFAAEPILTYPANLLQYVSTANSTAFPNATRTKDSSGTLDIIRGTNFGDPGFKGSGTVATVTFKVIGSSGTANVGISNTSGIFDSNGNNLLATRTGSAFGINAPSPPPPPTPQPITNPSPNPTPTPVSTGGGSKPSVYANKTAFTPSANGSASLNGGSTQVQGSVDVQPVIDPQVLAAEPGTSITKVEYYLGNNLVATKNSAPYTYSFDTKKLKNGTYSMSIKTYYSNGTVDTTKNQLLVKNPVTLSYVMAHYATDILVTVIALLIVALVIWKFIWPRFGGGALAGAGGGYMGGAGPAGYMSSDTNYEAPEPAVVTPAGGQDPSAVITPGQAAAAQDTQALGGQQGQSGTEFKPDSYGIPADGQTPEAPGQANNPAAPQSGSPEGQSPDGQNPAGRHIY